MERSNFPHRNLGEDDEELLNGIWAGLEMPDDRPDADGRDFDDVKDAFAAVCGDAGCRARPWPEVRLRSLPPWFWWFVSPGCCPSRTPSRSCSRWV